MDVNELRTHYQNYIECLNDRRFDQLDDYVAANVTYNGLLYTIEDYRHMLVVDTTSIPDLFFAIGLLVAENDHVAARLDFRCTPQREFLGFRPNGAWISFSENVFYKFTSGKITEVWSLIDRQAIERQLGTAHRISSFPIPATPAA
jgi:predicted ester cyclase